MHRISCHRQYLLSNLIVNINDSEEVFRYTEPGNTWNLVMLFQWKLLIIIKIFKMAKLKNIHPGEVLCEEFLIPLNVSAYKLAMDIDIPQTRLSQIIKGNRRITADTALRLSKYFGNSPKFWLGLQNDFDIEQELVEKSSIIQSIKTFKEKVA